MTYLKWTKEEVHALDAALFRARQHLDSTRKFLELATQEHNAALIAFEEQQDVVNAARKYVKENAL